MVTVSDNELLNRLRHVFNRTWPLVLGEGILSVVIGLLLVTSPVRTVLFMLQVLGVYWFLAGIARVVTSFIARGRSPAWGWRLAGGIVFTLLGGAIMAYPLYSAAFTGVALVYALAAFAVSGGVLAVAWGVRMLAIMRGEWLTITGGLMSVLFGIMMFAAPFFVVTALLIFTGVFAVLGGMGEILLSVRMHAFSLHPREEIERHQYAAR
jgi:uncharacterized membrane protein HdeD (DUF308 family)